MLFNIDGKMPTRDAHSSEFRIWRSRISDADYQAVVRSITAFCDRCDEVFCASWMPGGDPAIAAALPALEAACGGNQDQSALFFGNIVWRVVFDRDDEWYFKPTDRDSEVPLGMTYFRKRK